jgi:hypothetical protein
MKGRALALIALLLGLATLAVFQWLGSAPEVAAVYTNQGQVGEAVSAFQRAETTEDLARVFGDPINPTIVAAQNVVNARDLYAFIPAYTLFLIASALLISAGQRGLFTWTAIGLAVIAGAADAGETMLQLRIGADVANAAPLLPVAPWHWAKVFALGLNGLAITAICLLGASKRWILGIAALAPLPLALAAFVGIGSTRLFIISSGVYWLALLAIAIIETVRGRGAQA